MVKALAPDAPEGALGGGVSSRCADGGAQHLDPTGRRDAGKLVPEFPIVVAEQEVWGHALGRRLRQLLRHPPVGGAPPPRSMTWRKSQAQIASAWLRMKAAQRCPRPAGGGGRAPRMWRRTVRSATRMRRLRSAPRRRAAPHR